MKWINLALCSIAFAGPSHAADISLNRGDHVVLVGNLLAERMQHDGWLEAVIQHRVPRQELVFRNIGFSGDELTERFRSQDFGGPDDWLARCEADQVWAFFGYNESFDDEAGLPAFKQQLADYVAHLRGQRYNGSSAPRIVLFSPIAFENHGNPNLPDGREHNRRLELYARAMSDVARELDVPFVDLFHPTLARFEPSSEQLTLNGHYLTDDGNRFVAEVIARAVFGDAQIRTDGMERLRQAVQDKNFYWFHRYRTTDGFNVYGGRAHKAYTDNLTNLTVMQREMAILDAMTANRDKRVWAVARGEDLDVDDQNTPPFIPVKTNTSGDHVFLSGEAAIEKMTVAEGMKVELFASDEDYPELVNPVQMAFDPAGRLFVAVWPSYPHWTPKDEMNDKLLILEDTNGDGRADRVKTFADRLNNPSGFEFWGGGVLVAMVPDLLFLKDTDGDDVADVRIRVLHGIDSADTHHSANSFVLGPDGALYFQEGTFHMSQIETPAGAQRNTNGCVWRFDPRTWKVDRYVAYNFANPHGHVFDRWGQDFVHDGTGAVPYHATLFSGHVEFPDKHRAPPVLYDRRTRPCPGTEILSSRHFPENQQGNLLVANVIGVQGILQYKIEENESSFSGTEIEPILTSSDPNFRPTDLEMGPDGALYFVDWQNPIIGHLQHHIRDPNRDKTHGRVYRVTYPSRPLLDPPRIAGAAVDELVALLAEPEDRARSRARIELSGRQTTDVIEALHRWTETLDKNDPDYDHHWLEVLWMHQQHNVVNENLLRHLLGSPDHRVRAAATRVLCYWRDRIPASLDLLKKLAADPHAHVRLQAVRAASFYRVPEAVEVPIISAEFPADRYVDFLRNETMRTLDPFWKKAIADGRRIAVSSDAGMRFLLDKITTDELIAMKRERAVYVELLSRDGVRDEYRHEALIGLAELENKSPLAVLLDAVANLDEKRQNDTVVFDLVRLLTSYRADQLAEVRPLLEAMALEGHLSVVRRVGFVALITADAGVDRAWQRASRNLGSLRDLIDALPLIPDAAARMALYPRVAPLVDGVPPALAESAERDAAGMPGRYVRIELPGRRKILTLAEVEVISGGTNVAQLGTASQSSVASGGVPERAIDGNTNGSYNSGTQTHTRERSRDPWWEVDLGQEYPIESLAIHNRTDGDLGNRLDNFTVTILAEGRRPVFASAGNPAPTPAVAIEVGGGDPASLLRRSAMNAMTFVRGQETETFTTLARFVHSGVDRPVAIRSITRIPKRFWPAGEAAPLVASILEYVRDIPTEERTAPAALAALQLGGQLAAMLPPDEARRVRAALGDLGVQVVRIGTLPHRMAFDTERVIVEAGKPVEFLFENSDLMPHNFVITRPGALEEVGMLAEATAQQPDAVARQYVPSSDKILLASRLLASGQVQKLSYTAPERPGVYPYVCTYPGHWRRMFGALYVVADLDAYLANPEAYLAENPQPPADELLKFNRPRTEWLFEDLESSVASLDSGRSFENAKQMFDVASCTACHKLNGVGKEIGPDLTKLDEKFTALAILDEVLDPSKNINEKFVTMTVQLDSGVVVTGLVLEETPDHVTLIEDPLVKSDPLVIKQAEIAAQRKSNVSIMPKGLLDKLTRDEILDLIAYITARGDQNHKLFKPHHH